MSNSFKISAAIIINKKYTIAASQNEPTQTKKADILLRNFRSKNLPAIYETNRKKYKIIYGNLSSFGIKCSPVIKI